MKTSLNRKTYQWFVIIAIFFSLVALSEFFLSRYIEDTIKRKLATLNATVDEVDANILSRSLVIKQLEWQWSENKASLYPRRVSSEQVSISGIRWLSFLFKETLNIDHLSFDEGLIEFNMRVRKNSTKIGDSTFTSFSFKNISLKSINALLVSDAIIKDVETVYIKAGEPHTNKYYAIYVKEAEATKVQVDWPAQMYSGTITKVTALSKEGRMVVDSIQLTPSQGKIEFGKQAGRQISRVTLAVPQLIVNDLKVQEIFTNALIIPRIHIESFSLVSFKDKRLPFIQERDRTLPMESLRKIPFAIQIDSISIGKSQITVEEFPVNGTTTSTITFENVEAVCTGINNRVKSSKPVLSLLRVKGQFMGDGLVEAVFELPLNDPAIYTAQGSISKMNLLTLNPVLALSTNLQIKSGYVNQFRFQFDYSDYSSRGNVDITYRDLQFTNKLKTQSNALSWENVLIRNATYRSSNLLSSSGVIDIERNRKKWIFNIWWESIKEGLRNSVIEDVMQASAKSDDE